MKNTLLAIIGLLLSISAGFAGTPVPLADAQMDMVVAGQFDFGGYSAADNAWTANVQSLTGNWLSQLTACALVHCQTFFPVPPLPSPPQANQFLHLELAR